LAIGLDSEYPDTHCERGVSLYESYRFAEALKSLRVALALDPQYGRPHHFLGCIYDHLGEEDRSREELQLAARLDGEEEQPPLALEPDDFTEAVKEACHVIPRPVQRHLAGIRVESERLPDRLMLADGLVLPS